MQVETLSIVVTAAATVATALVAAASLVLGLFNAFADARRRKPHARVTLRAGYARDQQGRGYKYGAVLVVNDGQVAFFVEQVGFKLGKLRGRFLPVENWNDRVPYGRILVPGDRIEIALDGDKHVAVGADETLRAFVRIAQGAEFCSEPITEQTPGAFSLVKPQKRRQSSLSPGAFTFV